MILRTTAESRLFIAVQRLNLGDLARTCRTTACEDKSSEERRKAMTAMTAIEEAESFAAYDAIAATLQHYIDGARGGESGLMRRAFIEGASIRGSYGAKPVDWSVSDFCEIIDKGGPAPALKARIASIELAGSAAMARLEAENWRGTRYTDFFVLIVRDGVWQIASKVFFAHTRA
jgi:hypothetical protein